MIILLSKKTEALCSHNSDNQYEVKAEFIRLVFSLFLQKYCNKPLAILLRHAPSELETHGRKYVDADLQLELDMKQLELHMLVEELLLTYIQVQVKSSLVQNFGQEQEQLVGKKEQEQAPHRMEQLEQEQGLHRREQLEQEQELHKKEQLVGKLGQELVLHKREQLVDKQGQELELHKLGLNKIL